MHIKAIKERREKETGKREMFDEYIEYVSYLLYHSNMKLVYKFTYMEFNICATDYRKLIAMSESLFEIDKITKLDTI